VDEGKLLVVTRGNLCQKRESISALGNENAMTCFQVLLSIAALRRYMKGKTSNFFNEDLDTLKIKAGWCRLKVIESSGFRA
jgi:hypothetical protein